jgi:acetyl esterase/lipase
MTRRIRNPRMTRIIGASALTVALLLLALSMLAVFPAPTYGLWKLRILVTECGHFIAPLCLLTPLVWRRSTLSRIASVVAVAAACVLFLPLMTSIRVLRTLPAPRPSVARYVRSLYFGNVRPVASQHLQIKARNGQALRFGFYPVAGSIARVHAPPLVVMIHGGSWQGGTATQLAPLSWELTRRGYAVASVTYSFAPGSRFPSQMQDISDQIAFLRERSAVYGFDSTRIAVLGRSAGGQLALLYAYTTRASWLKGVISFYGPTDLAWGYAHPSKPRVHDSRRYLSEYLGGTPEDHGTAYAQASPIRFAAASKKPTLLVHGTTDDLVFIGHTRRLAAVLLDARKPATVVELPWATHGCDYIVRGPCYRISTIAVEQFLAEVLPP